MSDNDVVGGGEEEGGPEGGHHPPAVTPRVSQLLQLESQGAPGVGLVGSSHPARLW